jgi:hypothetical protein
MVKRNEQNDICRAVIVNLKAGVDISPEVINQLFSKRASLPVDIRNELDEAALDHLRLGGKLPCRIISNLMSRSSQFTPSQHALLAEQTLQPEIEPGERSEILSVLHPGWQSTG